MRMIGGRAHHTFARRGEIRSGDLEQAENCDTVCALRVFKKKWLLGWREFSKILRSAQTFHGSAAESWLPDGSSYPYDPRNLWTNVVRRRCAETELGIASTGAIIAEHQRLCKQYRDRVYEIINRPLPYTLDLAIRNESSKSSTLCDFAGPLPNFYSKESPIRVYVGKEIYFLSTSLILLKSLSKNFMKDCKVF